MTPSETIGWTIDTASSDTTLGVLEGLRVKRIMATVRKERDGYHWQTFRLDGTPGTSGVAKSHEAGMLAAGRACK